MLLDAELISPAQVAAWSNVQVMLYGERLACSGRLAADLSLWQLFASYTFASADCNEEWDRPRNAVLADAVPLTLVSKNEPLIRPRLVNAASDEHNQSVYMITWNVPPLPVNCASYRSACVLLTTARALAPIQLCPAV